MFDFLMDCIIVTYGNYFSSICAIKTTIMFQLIYNVHTFDRATCSNFHHPLHNTFAYLIPIDTIYMTTNAPLLKNYCLIMLCLQYKYLYNLIRIYVHI